MENLEKIKSALDRIKPMASAEWEAFNKKLSLKSFKKGSFVTAYGQIENHIYFINEGATRNYFSKEGKEYTVDFHFEGDFVTAYYSFITRKPSFICIEALTDIEAISISYDSLQWFYEHSTYGARLGQLMAEKQYLRRLQKEMDLLALTAEERYAQLMEKNAALICNISVKHLSSYLGIQPESLSRIRKLHARN